MATRTPRGYGVVHPQLQEVFEGKRPSLSDQKTLVPAPWLPVAEIDAVHDDPIVIPAGTWVGRINQTDQSDIYTAVTAALRTDYLVPACASTGEYTITYTASDLDTPYGLTPDIDNYPTVIAAAGTSTLDLPQVKPIGICTYPMYASHLATTYTNYNRQHMPGFLSWGYVVMVPVYTDDEALIEPGDLVVVDANGNAATTWAPTAPATNVVGRLAPFISGTDTAEFVVGRCLEKIELATTSGSADTKLQTEIDAGRVSSAHSFGGLEKLQTLPGLGLSGSGTQGIPGWLTGARATSGKKFYSLLISVSCV